MYMSPRRRGNVLCMVIYDDPRRAPGAEGLFVYIYIYIYIYMFNGNILNNGIYWYII